MGCSPAQQYCLSLEIITAKVWATHSLFFTDNFVAYSVPAYADKSVSIIVFELILETVLLSRKIKSRLKLLVMYSQHKIFFF